VLCTPSSLHDSLRMGTKLWKRHGNFVRTCTGAGCPHVLLQDKLEGKTTSLAEQGALAGTQEKKEGLSPMEERAGNSRGTQGSP